MKRERLQSIGGRIPNVGENGGAITSDLRQLKAPEWSLVYKTPNYCVRSDINFGCNDDSLHHRGCRLSGRKARNKNPASQSASCADGCLTKDLAPCRFVAVRLIGRHLKGLLPVHVFLAPFNLLLSS